MKTILFCNLPYAFSILKPLADELRKRGDEYIWYVDASLVDIFPYKNMPSTQSIKELELFQSDAIFVCGNDVPYWLRGVKVQIFHGLAGEKKGHFRIRDYFDLYLTQGPYFTDRFKALALKHKNFEVIETGWCKLDNLYSIAEETKRKKIELLEQYGAKKMVLYAPTFSPSLTSALVLEKTIKKLSEQEDILVIVKFHDKMGQALKEPYEVMDNLLIIEADDITASLQMADLMISDSSSVVYEFTLLDKPVVTFNSISENIDWLDLDDADEVYDNVLAVLGGDDTYRENRKSTIRLYHPYGDGKSAMRMVESVKKYIEKSGIPMKRKVSLLRKYKMLKAYKR
ncbi:MAG: CDP-glycerol glycerophosphotransferase family protein [Sulfurovaceae bacterium]|nr:CDP-glycerol glycerophosphotransferase family protein [Sulfurovaceae bacterium]